MDTIIIFIAEYLIFASPAAAILYFLAQPRGRQKEMLIFAAILLPLSYISARIVSRFYFDPRPFVAGNFAPLIPHAADNGFPSDHALLGAAIAFAVFRFDQRLGSVLLILAIFVGAARVVAGVHHVMDIAGSIAIVLAIYSIIFVFRRFDLRNEKYAQKRTGGK